MTFFQQVAKEFTYSIRLLNVYDFGSLSVDKCIHMYVQ